MSQKYEDTKHYCCKKTWYINSGNTCTPRHANKDKGIENRNWKLDVTCFYQHSGVSMRWRRREGLWSVGRLAPERKEGPLLLSPCLINLLTWKPIWRRDLCPFSSPSHLGKRQGRNRPLGSRPGSAVGPGVGVCGKRWTVTGFAARDLARGWILGPQSLEPLASAYWSQSPLTITWPIRCSREKACLPPPLAPGEPLEVHLALPHLQPL